MKSSFLLSTALLCAGLLAAEPATAKIEKASWGETADHQKVDIYTLTNGHGMSARITNYGAFLVSLNVPDKNGKMADVVLGYDKLEDYTHRYPVCWRCGTDLVFRVVSEWFISANEIRPRMKAAAPQALVVSD